MNEKRKKRPKKFTDMIRPWIVARDTDRRKIVIGREVIEGIRDSGGTKRCFVIEGLPPQGAVGNNWDAAKSLGTSMPTAQRIVDFGQRRHNAAREVLGDHRRQSQQSADGVRAASQRLIPRDERLASYWIGFTKFAHTHGDPRKQITGPKFKIIFVEIGHSQARTGSRLNHVNIVAIDNSVRFDIVPKI